jgi:hypothetical protein
MGAWRAITQPHPGKFAMLCRNLRVEHAPTACRNQPASHGACVKRRVSVRGAIMIGGQHIQVGLPHAGKTAEVTIETGISQITVEDGITISPSRTTSRVIKRHKASQYGNRYAQPQQ